MKAVRIHRFGDPAVLTYEDAPPPTPGDDEVLIRVQAVGINPVDWKTRAGRGVARLSKLSFPAILGWDISGVVESLGGEVTGLALGDDVYGMVRFPDLGNAYAELVVAPMTHVLPKPNALTHAQAAALPLVSLTAWQALFELADLQPGQRILIHAAAGGVGHMAVQLAKWKGAFVIGTASGRNADFLRELGVDQFIDYTSTRFEDVVRDVDIVLDPMAGETRERSWQVIKNGGVLVSIQGEPSADAAAAHGVQSTQLLVRPDRAQLTEISKLVDRGYLKPHISSTFPLHDVQKAHTMLEQGHTRGKIVLHVS